MTFLERLRALSLRTQLAILGAAAIAVVAGGAAGIAMASGEAGEPEVVAVIDTSTPTPTPTPAPPTPTPTPDGPVPAELIPLGESVGLVNPSSIGFPEPPPSTVTPVAGTGIVRMFAPSLGLDHYIETVGVVDGKMESPDADGNHAVGWYAPDSRWDFGTPGEIGNSVFSAHETWNHLQGPFYQVHEARIGDFIYLDLENGERRKYQIARVTRYPVGEMPMREVLWPSDRPEYEEWITLYTCGGEIVYDATGYGDYLARDVLVARWVGSEQAPTAGTSVSSPGATPAATAAQ